MFKTQLLYQNDAKWQNVKLGNSSETIGGWGGLLTSITMMLNGLGYNETPKTVNAKLMKQGGFLKALPSLMHLTYLWPNCVYDGITRCEHSDAPLAKIDEAVATGKPVILQVSSKEKTGSQTHFVLVQEKQGADYLVYDPYREKGDALGKEVLLTTRYKSNSAKLESEIKLVLWFSRRCTVLPKRSNVVKLPVPPEKYRLFVAEDGLILRDQPSTDSFPWKGMLKGTELICLEPKATAQAKLKAKDRWIQVQDPDGDQGFVSASFLVPPQLEVATSFKKWCLKNVSLQHPVIEMLPYPGSKEIPLGAKPVKSFDSLLQNTVVSVLKSDEAIPGWTGILFEETYHDSGVQDWVTVRVTGWAKETDLDDYREEDREEFRKFVVDIPDLSESSTDGQQDEYVTKTESSTDGQQDVYVVRVDKDGKIIEKRAHYNLCGEFCVASIVGKSIDTVLKEWRDKSRAIYDSMVGNADKPLERAQLEDLFIALQIGDRKKRWHRYKLDEDGKTLLPNIDFADSNGDGRLASQALEDNLKDHYFIANVRINTTTGDLQSTDSGERNHWVVLDRVTRNRSRIEIYNPFPNQREEYSFGEFYRSIGGNPNVGWWINREVNPTFAKQKADAGSRTEPNALLPSEESFQPPTFQVAIDNQTANPGDAEQYLRVRGEASRPKTKLCGEFCMTFIIGQSLESSLKHWMENQGKQAGLRELSTLLQSYGFNRKKYILQKDAKPEAGKYYVVPNVEQSLPSNPDAYFKSFSIDTVLEYWKGVQPDLYNSILGGNTNEPTGTEDLMTILKAYGYSRDNGDYSYYRPGSQEAFGYAPGRDAAVLEKTHYVIVGVNINGTTGRLRPSGVPHWVVVTKINPRGNLVGGNGGWVELYNPFPNCWEEYSYREFMDALRGTGEGSTLWIKKDITPVFTRQIPAAAKSKDNGKGNQKAKSDDGKDKNKKDAKLQAVDDTTPLDTNQFVCEHLDVDAIPWEVGKWIGDTAAGDEFFAQELTDILLESGILSIQENKDKKTCTAVLTDPHLLDGAKTAIQKSIDSLASSRQHPVFKVASAALPLFTAKAIQEIKEKQKDTPVHAYQPLGNFRAWTFGLASQAADGLEADIKKRLESLAVSEQDLAETIPAVCRTILTRFSSTTFEQMIQNISSERKAEIEKIFKSSLPKPKETIDLLEFLKEWGCGLTSNLTLKPGNKVYRVKRWDDPGMHELGFDINLKNGLGSNFQAVGLYNTGTNDFSAVSKYLMIPHEDVLRLEALQIEDQYEDKRPDWLYQKMDWLCNYRGSIYMFADEEVKGDWAWRRSDGIRWGTLALGGNLVQVVGEAVEFPSVKLPGKASAQPVKMFKVKGFEPADWGRPLDELLAEGLVHRCYCVYQGNGFGDTPKGIVYSPFWSAECWTLMPKPTKGSPSNELWIPVDYLENAPA